MMERVSRGRRSPRWPLFLAALGGAGVALVVPASQAGSVTPSGCTSIANVPVTASIQFLAAIQANIFHNFSGDGVGCDACHTSLGGTVTPTGDLDLDSADSPSPYANLINVPAEEMPGLSYVTPNYPERSFLFIKVNCDSPGAGSRMPLNFPALTLDQQALLYDWIAAGAPVGLTDQLFRGTFDIRGFAP